MVQTTMNRRDFVSRLSALFGAAAASGCATRSALGRADALTHSAPLMGVQLYSLRGLMQRDPEGTLAALAMEGFQEVEFAGFYGRTAREMRTLIDRDSLRSPAGHVSMDDIRGNLPSLLRDAGVMGWSWLIVPWIDQRERTLEGYHSIANALNDAGSVAAKSGVRVAYHAEDYDFRPLSGGRIPYDLLLAESDPAHVDFELDLYWAAKGGGNALGYISRYPGRFPLLHIKDITADGRMVNPGEGVIDFPAIVAAARRGGATHFIVENDEPVHPIEDVAAGLRYLKRIVR